MKLHAGFLLALCALTACAEEAPPPRSNDEPIVAPLEADPKAGPSEEAEEAAEPEDDRADPEPKPRRPKSSEPKPMPGEEAAVAERPNAAKKTTTPKKPQFAIASETSENFSTRLTNVTERPIMLTRLTFHSIEEGRLPVKLFRDFPGDPDDSGRFVCGGAVFEKIETEAERDLVNPFSRDKRVAFEGDDFVITGMTLMPGQSIRFGPYEKARFDRLDLGYVSLPQATDFLRLAEDGERVALAHPAPPKPGARSKKLFRLKFAFEAVTDVMTFESLRAIRWQEVANADCERLDSAVPPPYRYGVRGEVFDKLMESEVSAALAN